MELSLSQLVLSCQKPKQHTNFSPGRKASHVKPHRQTFPETASTVQVTFLVLEPGADPDPKPSSGKQMGIQSGQWYFTSRNSKQGCHPGVHIQGPFLSDVWVWVRPPSQTWQAKEDIHEMCPYVPWFFQGSECDFRRKTTERRGKVQNCFSPLFQARLRLPKEQRELLKWVGLCTGQSLLGLQTLEHWGLCLEMYRTEIIFLYSTLYAMPVKGTFPGHCSLLTTKSQTCLKYHFQPSLAWSYKSSTQKAEAARSWFWSHSWQACLK